MSRSLLLLKLKALLAHMAISAMLVAAALLLMLLHWFPPPLFATDGGGIGLKLLVLVDLVLGPLLTFVVFNPAKGRRKMGFDLGVIALLQLGAYGYGLWNIHAVRVQALAFYEGQFHAVAATSFVDQKLEPDSWQPLGDNAPYVVDVREPEDGLETSGVGAFQIVAGLKPYELHFLYEPYAALAHASHWPQGYELAALRRIQPSLADVAQAWLAERQLMAETVRFYPLSGFYGQAVVAIGQDGRWLGGFEGALPVLKASSASPRS